MTPPTPQPGHRAEPREPQPTRLVKSLLTGRVYSTDDYDEKPDPHRDGETVIVVNAKADVTDDYRSLVDAEHAARALLTDPLGQHEPDDPHLEARLRDVIRDATDRGVHSDTIDADPTAASAAETGGA